MKLVAAAGVVGLVLLVTSCATPGPAPDNQLGFFITSAGSGDGANLGGLAGADRICQTRAQAVGAGSRRWRAYLSAAARPGTPAVDARDRIGSGPWYNARGVRIAVSVADLHRDRNLLNKETSLTEAGALVNGRGDTPNVHDILTGSQADGTAYAGETDRTCGN